MKIISKVKDYYDGPAFQLGDWPVYIRETLEENYQRLAPNWERFYVEWRKVGHWWGYDNNIHGLIKIGNIIIPYRREQKMSAFGYIYSYHFIPNEEKHRDTFFFDNISSLVTWDKYEQDIPIIHLTRIGLE